MSTSFNRFKIQTYKWNSGAEKNDIIAMAKAAESAERYDDMCHFMKQLVQFRSTSGGLTVEERNLLSVAYKNVIGARRASWRTVTGEHESEAYTDAVKEKFLCYKQMIEDELKTICDEILEVLTKHCVDDSYDPDTEKASEDGHKAEGEAQVFYLKMAGDYYRYLAETIVDKTQGYEQKTKEYYEKAMNIAEKALITTHPIRLGLALNFSVCHFEILKNKVAACNLAKTAFDDAISKLDALDEPDYKDSTLIMQLLRDNLTLWTSTTEDGDVEGEKAS